LFFFPARKPIRIRKRENSSSIKRPSVRLRSDEKKKEKTHVGVRESVLAVPVKENKKKKKKT